MEFARKVWHLLVAIKDALVLLLLLVFFVLVHALVTARSGPPKLADGALLVALDGAVVEEPDATSGLPLGGLFGVSARKHQMRERDLVRTLRLAADDAHVKAVAIDATRFSGGGQVHMEEIGAAMDAIRAAHKPVLFYGKMLSDSGYLMAAHASEVWVDPLGGTVLTGPGGNHLYYAGLIEKLKINVHVFKVGTFKDFVEQYTRADASEPSKQARSAVYAALWSDWKANVAHARPKAQVDKVTTDPVGWLRAAGGDGAQATLAAGLADRVGTRAEWGDRVAALVGADPDDKGPGTFLHSVPASLLVAHKPFSGGKRIAVVTIAGDIVDGTAGPGTAGGTRIAKLLDDVGTKDIAGLVIRVDSPGGSVDASEAIRQAELRLKAKKIPVAVSMANLAASGGYWVSTPGARIFARPATVTGSIGIFGIVPTFEKTLANWGVTSDGVRTTPLSGQPDLAGGLSPEVEGMLQAYIERGYQRFVGLVAQSRGKTPTYVDSIAQGRIWDGATGQRIGLVDQQGGLDDALGWVAGQAGLKAGEWHADYLGADQGLWSRLRMSLGMDDGNDDDDDDGAANAGAPTDLFALAAARQAAVVADAMHQAEQLASGQGAQARCLDCAVADTLPQRPVAANAPAWKLWVAAKLAGWL